MTQPNFPHPAHSASLIRSFTMTNTLRLTLTASLFAIAQMAAAHDPAEHAKEAAAAKAAPNCAAMKDMDHSKMDPNDPVMKAMMAKCAKADKGHSGHDMKGMDMKGMDMPAAPAAATPKPDAHGDH